MIVIILFYLYIKKKKKKEKKINLILRGGRLKKVIVLQSRVMRAVEISFLTDLYQRSPRVIQTLKMIIFGGVFLLVSRFDPQKIQLFCSALGSY